ncbi:MAG: hypothetical protein Kow0031_21010 [Anaerolineae bacterium]
MKLAKVILTGLLIWGASLIWPQVNQWLTHGAMLWGVIGLGSLTAGYMLMHLRRHPQNGANISPPSILPPNRVDTGPFKPVGIA